MEVAVMHKFNELNHILHVRDAREPERGFYWSSHNTQKKRCLDMYWMNERHKSFIKCLSRTSNCSGFSWNPFQYRNLWLLPTRVREYKRKEEKINKTRVIYVRSIKTIIHNYSRPHHKGFIMVTFNWAHTHTHGALYKINFLWRALWGP